MSPAQATQMGKGSPRFSEDYVDPGQLRHSASGQKFSHEFVSAVSGLPT